MLFYDAYVEWLGWESCLAWTGYCGLSGYGGAPVSLCRLLFMILRGWILAEMVDSDVRAIFPIFLVAAPVCLFRAEGHAMSCILWR